MDPVTQGIIVSIVVSIIGKLFDKYFEKSKKFPKYEGYLTIRNLKSIIKKEVFKMTGYKTKLGCIVLFLGGVLAVLKGIIVEPLDPNAIWLGATAAAGAFAGWGVGDKVQRLLDSKNIR